MSLFSIKPTLPLMFLISAIAAPAGAKDDRPTASVAASQYASIPHIVIVAKRLTPEQKRR